MPICIECSYPVSHLYSTYSRADDRSLGKGVRLTQCPRCKRFADNRKYADADNAAGCVLASTLILSWQVYRHLLFNRLGRDDDQFDPSIVRLGILLLLFDVYLTWARIEKSSDSLATSFLARAPIVVQYLFFLSLNALATLAHHLTVRFLAAFFLRPAARPPRAQEEKSTPSGNPDSADRLSTSASAVSADIDDHLAGPTEATSNSGETADLSPSGVSSCSTPTRDTVADGSKLHGAAQVDSSRNPTPTLVDSTAAFPPQPLAHPSPPQSASQPTPPPPTPPPRPPPHSRSTTFSPSSTSRRPSEAQGQTATPLPRPFPASPTAISTALLVSSCAKLFPILLVIWGPDGSGTAASRETASAESIRSVATALATLPQAARAVAATASASASAPASATGTATSTTASALALASLSSHAPSSTITAAAATTPYRAVERFFNRFVSVYPSGDAASGGSPSSGCSLSSPLSFFQGAVSLLSLSAADTHLVLLSNIEALYILLGCGYLRAVVVAVAGQGARWVVQKAILGLVGVG